MIDLFETVIKTNDRQSSKGNQLKWMKNNVWYKADYTGYEGLAEFAISNILKKTNLNENEFVSYELEQIRYKTNIYNGCSSYNFLHDGWQIITLERLFQSYYNESLNSALWKIDNPIDRLKFLVEAVEKITGLKKFGVYMNKVFTIDAVFLNEDRHTHNIAVLMDETGKFDYCPIFDNGAGLLSDTTMDYPLEEDIYKLIDSVESKTISFNFDEQLEASEKLYGMNLKFKLTKKDVYEMLHNNENIKIYNQAVIERLERVIYEQMRKYSYLFD